MILGFIGLQGCAELPLGTNGYGRGDPIAPAEIREGCPFAYEGVVGVATHVIAQHYTLRGEQGEFSGRGECRQLDERVVLPIEGLPEVAGAEELGLIPVRTTASVNGLLRNLLRDETVTAELYNLLGH